MIHAPKKILIIRLSSIGDIVLTTPVLRCLKKKWPEVEIQCIVKGRYVDLLRHNPRISKVHILKNSLSESIQELRKEQFDVVIDLHRNFRSRWICFRLQKPVLSIKKSNWKKWLMVRAKLPLTVTHVVDRYLATLKKWNIQSDEKGLELFIPTEVEQQARRDLDAYFSKRSISFPPIAIALGATHGTKKWLPEYFLELIHQVGRPVIMLGGVSEVSEAKYIESSIQVPCFNAVGKYDLLTSAALMKEASLLITHDTGMMHIASAFQMKIISLWGSTVPQFGMAPYKTSFDALEVNNLNCRPCSRIGYEKCPQGHFRCMRDLLPATVASIVRRNLSS